MLSIMVILWKQGWRKGNQTYAKSHLLPAISNTLNDTEYASLARECFTYVIKKSSSKICSFYT